MQVSKALASGLWPQTGARMYKFLELCDWRKPEGISAQLH